MPHAVIGGPGGETVLRGQPGDSALQLARAAGLPVPGECNGSPASPDRPSHKRPGMTDKVVLTPAELQGMMGPGAIVIDTLPRDAFAAGHIPRAVNVHEIVTYLASSTPEGVAALRLLPAELARLRQGRGAATTACRSRPARRSPRLPGKSRTGQASRFFWPVLTDHCPCALHPAQSRPTRGARSRYPSTGDD